jgi:hypothetical protein
VIDARVLVVAALVASPAAYRTAQGLLSVSEAMTRYLLVALGCVVVSVVVRALWPLVAGPDEEAATEAALREAAALLPADGPAETAVLGDAQELDDLDGFGGFSAFDDLEPA